ncbi:MAG: glycosyltransferase [bacterium]
MADDLAIIIPVYNEGDSVIELIDQIKQKVREEYCVYFVYDFDEDTTLPCLKRMENAQIMLLRNKYGRGVLNAIKTGIKDTKESYAVVFMSDMSEDPGHINDMMAKAKEGYDVVCGSRYMKGGDQIGGPKFKSFLSKMAGLSLHLLTGIPTHDISNSFKLYSRKVLDSIKVESTGGFEIGMEIIIKAYLKGFSISEVPVVWRDREKGRSNFKFAQWLPKYLYWYFYLLKGRLWPKSIA